MEKSDKPPVNNDVKSNSGLPENYSNVLPSAAASIEMKLKYENIESRLAHISGSYLVAATKAISLNTQYSGIFLESMSKVTASYSGIVDKMASLLPDISKQLAVSPFLESARAASLSIQDISSSYLKTNLGFFQEKTNLYLSSVSLSSKLPSISSGSYFPKMDIAVSSLLNSKLVEKVEAMKFGITASFARISECSIAAESSLSRLTQQNIASFTGLMEKNRTAITNSFLDATKDYSKLWESFQNKPLDYAQCVPSIVRLTPIEHLWNANLLEAISLPFYQSKEQTNLKTGLIEENENDLNVLLSKVNRELLKLWDGAKSALNSDNPDKIRHFAISIRELFTYVLHSLAPNEELIKWTKDPKNYHKGKPTRKARLLYICRGINHSGLVSFIKSDIKAILEFIDLFQEGTHAISPSFSESQILAVKAKSEATLKFILEIGIKKN